MKAYLITMMCLYILSMLVNLAGLVWLKWPHQKTHKAGTSALAVLIQFGLFMWAWSLLPEAA